MERDNDDALTQGARPNQQHEPAARYNGAQCGATANTPIYALHIALSPTEYAERLPHYDGNPSLFKTPEAAAHSPDSAYVSWWMEPDADEWTVLLPSEYHTPNRGASSSILAPSLTTERADKSEQLFELIRKDRQASPSPQASSMEQHRSHTSQESWYNVKKATAP